MRIARIYTGEDGQSHFEELAVPFEANPDGPAGRGRSPGFPATGFSFRDATSDEVHEFHPAPQRQLVITLRGTVELECGDGTRRTFGPGDMFLADDTTGQGHRSHIGGSRQSIVIPVPADFDLSELRPSS